MTSGTPAASRVVVVCSREEPVPKLYPETRMTPRFVPASAGGGEFGLERIEATYSNNECCECGVIVLHHDFRLLLQGSVILVGVFPLVDATRV